jgi:hypothetical protein
MIIAISFFFYPNPSNPKVIAMEEFALLQTELKPVLQPSSLGLEFNCSTQPSNI